LVEGGMCVRYKKRGRQTTRAAYGESTPRMLWRGEEEEEDTGRQNTALLQPGVPTNACTCHKPLLRHCAHIDPWSMVNPLTHPLVQRVHAVQVQAVNVQRQVNGDAADVLGNTLQRLLLVWGGGGGRGAAGVVRVQVIDRAGGFGGQRVRQRCTGWTSKVL
jgi:hypothetical protein